MSSIFDSDEEQDVQTNNVNNNPKQEDDGSLSDLDELQKQNEEINQGYNTQNHKQEDQDQQNGGGVDDLSELSDSGAYDKPQEKVKQLDQLPQDYDEDDDLDDEGFDSDNEQEFQSQKKSKKDKKSRGSKGGRKKKSDQLDVGVGQYEQVQNSQKNKEEIELQAFADDLAGSLIGKMKVVGSKDQEAIKHKRPAIHRIVFMKQMFQTLKNEIVKITFIEDNDGLDELNNWIIHCPVKNITLRKKILQLLLDLQIRDSEILQTSKIVRHCIDMKEQIQMKNSKVPFDKETKRLYVTIVDNWAPVLANRVRRED